MPRTKRTRDTFLYLEPHNGEGHEFAQCGTCCFLNVELQRCRLLGADDTVTADMSCGMWTPGSPTTRPPACLFTPEEVGLVDRKVRCENCGAFDGKHTCALFKDLNEKFPDIWDLDTTVKPVACCNAQEPKEEVSKRDVEDEPRDERGRWEGGGSRVQLSPHEDRVFKGEQKDVRTQMSKQEVGALGEKVAVSYLQSKGLTDAKPLNMHTTNFPVDLVGDHQLVEVKTGLVSNGRSAQQWRATIGEPGKEEKAWLKKASAEAKQKWNAGKQQAILDRKNKVLAQFSKQVGTKMKGVTMGIILNPDTKTADIHVIPGFHARVSWNSDTAKAHYVGTFRWSTK